MRFFSLICVLSLSCVLYPFGAFATDGATKSFDHSHKIWNEILQANVIELRGPSATALKYKSIDRNKLNQYISNSLAVKKSAFDKWSKNQRLAFFFNLYNALTVQLILKKYPVKSIKDIGSFFSSTWKKKFFTLFGKKSYLDMIEHEYVRGSGLYNEPRVHFAFNCASIGCPALKASAFTADKLDDQLEKAAVNFLKDPKRNYYDAKKKKLRVSKIFKWYKDDFAKGWKGYKSLPQFFAKYAEHISQNPEEQKLIKEQKVPISYDDYNWGLNQAK